MISSVTGCRIAEALRASHIKPWRESSNKERLNPHALDHLTHLWQSFRKGERRYQSTDTIRAVTGRNPQALEEFFLANANSFSATAE